MTKIAQTLIGLILFNLFISSTFAQPSQIIKGTVKDSKDSSPVPFANVYFKATSEGTVTNTRGEYRLPFSEKHKSDSLIFSFVGYKPHKIAFANIRITDSLHIKLEEQPLLLKEIEVLGTTPFTYLKEAAKKTSESHLSPAILNSYYREFISKNGHYIKFADALVDYLVEYDKKRGKSSIKTRVTESRAMKKPFKIETRAGSDFDIPQLIHIDDLPDLFNVTETVEKRFKDGADYTFDLFETSDGNGNEFYKIKYTPKQGIEKIVFEGEYFIDKETSLIHSISYFLPEAGIEHTKTLNLFGSRVKQTGLNVYIQFKQIGARCHIQYAKASVKFHVWDKKGGDITHIFTTEMLVNQTQHENVVPFSAGEIYHRNSIYKRGNNFKTRFWEGQRGLLATEEEEKIIESLDTKNPPK